MLLRLQDATGAMEGKRAAEAALERLKKSGVIGIKVLRLGEWRGGEGKTQAVWETKTCQNQGI